MKAACKNSLWTIFSWQLSLSVTKKVVIFRISVQKSIYKNFIQLNLLVPVKCELSHLESNEYDTDYHLGDIFKQIQSEILKRLWKETKETQSVAITQSKIKSYKRVLCTKANLSKSSDFTLKIEISYLKVIQCTAFNAKIA